MHHFDLIVSHRPNSDGSVPDSKHVPFYLAMEVMSEAWKCALAVTCDGLLSPGDLGVVNVTSDFRRELFVGTAAFRVAFAHIGTSSIRFEIAVEQAGHHVADAAITLARVTDDRTRSLPLSPEQRVALSALAAG